MGLAKKVLKEGIWLGGGGGCLQVLGINLLKHEVHGSLPWDQELLEHGAWHGEVRPDCCGNKALDGGIPGGADKETTCLEMTK